MVCVEVSAEHASAAMELGQREACETNNEMLKDSGAAWGQVGQSEDKIWDNLKAGFFVAQ